MCGTGVQEPSIEEQEIPSSGNVDEGIGETTPRPTTIPTSTSELLVHGIPLPPTTSTTFDSREGRPSERD